MKTFKVFRHPVKGFDVVKVGFSWPALFFGIIWMLIKKLYGWFFLWIAMFILLSLVEVVTVQSIESIEKIIVSLIIIIGYWALWLIPGFKGNKWREKNLQKRGYELIDTIQAETRDAALALIAKSNLTNPNAEK